MAGGFQGVVNRQPAPAKEGAFASANPRRSMVAGEGALVSGPVGVIIGRFAYADANGQVFNAKPAGPARLGFVHEDQVVVIVQWLGGYGMMVQPGIEITLFDGGDFWARFAAPAANGQKVFVDDVTGLGIAGAPGAVIAGATESTWSIVQPCGAGELAKINSGV